MDTALLALVAHGNDALAHGEAPELLLSCSAFRRVRRVEFAFARGDVAPPAGTSAWLEELAARGVGRLDLIVNLRVGPEASAVQGGLGWSVETRYPHHAARWQAEWRRDVLLLVEGEPRPLGLAATADGALESAAAALDAALAEAQEVDAEHGLGFGWLLADARTALADADPHPARCVDLLPPRGFPLGARRLVSAADRGWVFGAMGSWNDRAAVAAAAGPEAQGRFERATTGLLHALVIAAASGANAYRADA